MRRIMIASLALLIASYTANAQTTGGGGATGGGGGGGGGAGNTSGGFGGNFGQNTGNSGGAAAGAGTTQGFSGNLDAPTAAFGQTTGAGQGAGGAGSGIPTAINPFQTFYSNPQALGMQLVTIKTTTTGANTTQVTAFGQPMYATTTTGTVGGIGGAGAGRATQGGLGTGTGNFGSATYGATGGLNTGTLGGAYGGGGATTLGGAGGFGGAGGGLGGVGVGGVSSLGGVGGLGTATAGGVSIAVPLAFNTVGVSRAVPYITTLGFTPPKAAPGRLQSDVQQVVMRSNLLTSRGVQTVMDGATVVLRGRVADERERRLAESIVRLTPGVRELRNELIVQQQP